jgi:hypothetical protein
MAIAIVSQPIPESCYAKPPTLPAHQLALSTQTFLIQLSLDRATGNYSAIHSGGLAVIQEADAKFPATSQLSIFPSLSSKHSPKISTNALIIIAIGASDITKKRPVVMSLAFLETADNALQNSAPLAWGDMLVEKGHFRRISVAEVVAIKPQQARPRV